MAEEILQEVAELRLKLPTAADPAILLAMEELQGKINEIVLRVNQLINLA